MVEITVHASKLDLTTEPEVNKEEVITYLMEQIEQVLSIYNGKLATADIRLKTEGKDGRVVQKIEVRANIGGKRIIESQHSRNVYKTIDRAMTALRRQVQKHKTKRVDHRRHKSATHKLAQRREALKNSVIIEENDFIEEW